MLFCLALYFILLYLIWLSTLFVPIEVIISFFCPVCSNYYHIIVRSFPHHRHLNVVVVSIVVVVVDVNALTLLSLSSLSLSSSFLLLFYYLLYCVCIYSQHRYWYWYRYCYCYRYRYLVQSWHCCFLSPLSPCCCFLFLIFYSFIDLFPFRDRIDSFRELNWKIEPNKIPPVVTHHVNISCGYCLILLLSYWYLLHLIDCVRLVVEVSWFKLIMICLLSWRSNHDHDHYHKE